MIKKFKIKNIINVSNRIIYKIFQTLLILIIFPLVFLIRLLRNILLIRIVYFPSEKFGNFTITAELYFCEMNSNIIKPNKKYIDIFYFGRKCSNFYFKELVSRKIKYTIPFILGDIAHKIFNFMTWHEHINLGKYGYYSNRDILCVLQKNEIQLDLTKSEKMKGKELLESLFGIKENDKYICINVRDNAYDNSENDQFRNSKIETYHSTVNELIRRGFFIIRMGKKVESNFNFSHPRFIDYAKSTHYSEFLDIYLACNCYFAITTGTGWDSLPMIFRRPILFVNFAQPAYITSFYKDSITLFKHFYKKETNEELSLSEICKSVIFQVTRENEFKINGFYYKDNTPEEIYNACIDMLNYLDNNSKEMLEDNLNKKFWEIFPISYLSKYTNVSMHSQVHSLYSLSFLRNNPNWLS